MSPEKRKPLILFAAETLVRACLEEARAKGAELTGRDMAIVALVVGVKMHQADPQTATRLLEESASEEPAMTAVVDQLMAAIGDGFS